MSIFHDGTSLQRFLRSRPSASQEADRFNYAGAVVWATLEEAGLFAVGPIPKFEQRSCAETVSSIAFI